MKYLLLFLIMSACGKHHEPPTLDLRDSDGDFISNNLDDDKFIAKIVTVEETHATLEFETGYSDLKKHVFELSNKKDLEVHSKDLLVKNQLELSDKNFFSEFSQMTLHYDKKDFGQITTKTRVVINFSKMKNPPRSVYLVNESLKIKLSEWAETIELSLTQNDLEAIIQGRSFIWLSYMDTSARDANEAIIEKSYRVFYNRGNRTEVFYISKELSLDQIAKKLNVQSYKNIDEENLLTTTLKPEVSDWWLRLINKSDIVLVHANLRQLSDHYFLGLERITGLVTRSNGNPYRSFQINKNINSRMLLKIRSEKRSANFVESSKDERVRIGGRDNHDKYGCVEHTRSFSPEYLSEFTNDDLQHFFLINGIYSQQHNILEMRYLIDEIGPFWEIELSNFENVDLRLSSLNSGSYSQIGLYKRDKCIGSSSNKNYSNNLQSTERLLVLNIEAFIEKIPE